MNTTTVAGSSPPRKCLLLLGIIFPRRRGMRSRSSTSTTSSFLVFCAGNSFNSHFRRRSRFCMCERRFSFLKRRVIERLSSILASCQMPVAYIGQLPVAGSQKYQILILFELYPVRTISFSVTLTRIVLEMTLRVVLSNNKTLLFERERELPRLDIN